MKKTDLLKRIRAVSLRTGKFKLRSGKISSFYWDKYRFESDPALLSSIVAEMEKLLPATFDKLAGMELGGIPLATALSLKTGIPCLFVRKIAKDYGTQNLIEGGFRPNEIAVIIEDVITTAGQVCSSVQKMRELGLAVNDVLCVIDRQQNGKENLKKIGCSLIPLLTLQELETIS